LSIIPVIDAIREGIERFAIKVGKPWFLEGFEAVPGRRACLIGTAEKLLFNIGRVPARQSGEALLHGRTANLAAGQKRGSPARLRSLLGRT
jgi:hypothetical protein